MATKTIWESDQFAAQIATIEKQIHELKQESAAADERATEAAADDDAFFKARGEVGAAQSKIASHKDRIRRLEIHRDAALSKERKERIAEIGMAVQKANLARDQYAAEQGGLIRKAEEAHKRAIAKIRLRYFELHQEACALESEWFQLESDEAERDLRLASPDEREALANHVRNTRDSASVRATGARDAANSAAACRKTIECTDG